ncbi:MAG: putative molybdenum carrier protein [Planctomycetes bacterium]|nr:putative molybdenum carrier protein [Planctomycetota bacterium]
MIERIITGGQTGVDRAALDVAIKLDLPCGGWCPKGRASEQGPIADVYPLTETPLADPDQRTEFNVRDADGTLIIAHGELTGGTALTRDLAASLAKPFLVVDPHDPLAAKTIAAWLSEQNVRILNVAGPRESRDPGIYERAGKLLHAVLGGDAPC